MIQKNNQEMKKGMFPYVLLLVIGIAIMFFMTIVEAKSMIPFPVPSTYIIAERVYPRQNPLKQMIK